MNGISKNLIGVYAYCTPIRFIYQGNLLVWGLNTESPEVPDIPVFNSRDVVLEVDTSINKTVTLPLKYWNMNTSGDAIDWGDGTVDNALNLSTPSYSKKVSHTYENEGKYLITITVNTRNMSMVFSDSWIGGESPITKIYSFGNLKYYQVSITSLMKHLVHIGSGVGTNNSSNSNGYTITNLGTPKADSLSPTIPLTVNLEGVLSHCEEYPITFKNCYFTEIEGDMFAGYTKAASYWTTKVIDGGYLHTIHKLSIPDTFSSYNFFTGVAIRRFGELKLSNTCYNVGSIMYNNHSSVRYMNITNIGAYEGSSTMNFSKFTNWGIASTSVPDARESVISSLITNSIDKSSGSKATSIQLADNTKTALTDEEIAQITSKGYTIL